MTRYDFCEIFSKAWFKAMTGSNIVSSFRATGVCPFNSHVFDGVQSEGDGRGSFRPQSLAERTGLAYIPLYNPSQQDTPSMTSTPCPHDRSITRSLSDWDLSFTCKSPQCSSKYL